MSLPLLLTLSLHLPGAHAAPPATDTPGLDRLFARSFSGIQLPRVPGARRLVCPLPTDTWPRSALVWVETGQWARPGGTWPQGAEILDQVLLALVPPGVTTGRFVVPEVGTVQVSWPDGAAGDLVLCTDARPRQTAWTVLGNVEPWVDGQSVRLSGSCKGLGDVDEDGSFALALHEDDCELRANLVTARGEVPGVPLHVHRPASGDLVVRLQLGQAPGE